MYESCLLGPTQVPEDGNVPPLPLPCLHPLVPTTGKSSFQLGLAL